MPFVFKSKPSTAESDTAVVETPKEVRPSGDPSAPSIAADRKYENLKGVCQVNRDDDGSTLLIKNAEGCRLSFPCSPKTVYLEGVRDSTLVFFPVRTSILMRNCERMSLVAAAQQVRIHDSTALRLYIHVDTAVIIEGCSGVEVAPYRLAEAGSLDAKYSRNSEEALKCAKIQDFDCVVGESPNWKVMDQALWKEFHALNVLNEE